MRIFVSDQGNDLNVWHSKIRINCHERKNQALD